MKKGFTLIELLVVVLIIGILSSMALPQYRKAVERARAAEAVSNIGTLMLAMDRYLLENGYPNQRVDVMHSALDIEMPEPKAGPKGIIYEGYCVSNWCQVSAHPRDNNYHLQAYRRSATNSQGWADKLCYYNSEIGRGVCEGLRGLGWEVDEGSV